MYNTNYLYNKLSEQRYTGTPKFNFRSLNSHNNTEAKFFSNTKTAFNTGNNFFQSSLESTGTFFKTGVDSVINQNLNNLNNQHNQNSQYNHKSIVENNQSDNNNNNVSDSRLHYYIDEMNKNRLRIDKMIKSKEIKSNYISYRPQHNLVNLGLEKMVSDFKNKQIREKNYQVEHKEFLLEFGESKAKQTEEADRLQTIRQVIKSKSKTDVKTFTILNEKINNIKNENNDDSSNTNQNNQHSKKVNLKNLKNLEYFQNNRLDKSDSDDNEVKKKVVKREYEKIINLKHLKTKSCENIIENYINKIAELQENYYNEEDNQLSTDVVPIAKFLNPIYNIRLTFGKNLKLKQIDPVKTKYSHHYKPLSVFDITNLKTISVDPRFRRKDQGACQHYPSTSADFSKLDPEKNPLSRRQIISKTKNFNLNETMSKLIDKKINIKIFKTKMLPPESNTLYSIDFLPSIKKEDKKNVK